MESKVPSPAELREALWLAACMCANGGFNAPDSSQKPLEMPTVVEPLVVEPLVVEPLVVEPLVVEPLVVEPLVVEPPVGEPLGLKIEIEPLIAKPVVRPYYLSELPVLRALRPLKQKIRYLEQSSDILDEEETAQRLAAFKLRKTPSGSLPIVFFPPRVRKFDLVILEDSAPTMQLYQAEVDVFLTALRHGGIFRRVEHYFLGEEINLTPKGMPAREDESIPLEDLAKCHSRLHPRIFILLSDLVASKWQDFATKKRSGLREALKNLASRHPVALAAMFPTRQWRYSALHYFIKPLKRPYPPFNQLGSWVKPVRSWRCADDLKDQQNAEGVAQPTWLPVFDFSNEGLPSWVRVLNGEVDAHIRAIDLSQPGQAPSQAETSEPWEKKLQRFLTVASPNAIRMASYLACTPKTNFPLDVLLYLGRHMLHDHNGPVPMDSDDLIDLVCSGLFRLDKEGFLQISEPDAAWELATKLPEYRKYEAAALFSWKFIAEEKEKDQNYFWLNVGKSPDKLSFHSSFPQEKRIVLKALLIRLYEITVSKVILVLDPAEPEQNVSARESNLEIVTRSTKKACPEFAPGKENLPSMKAFPCEPNLDYLNIPASRHLNFSFWGYKNYPDRQALLKAMVDALEKQGYAPRQVGHVGQEFLPVFGQSPDCLQRFDDTVLKITTEAGEKPWLVTYHDFADTEIEELSPALKASYRFSDAVLMVFNYEQMETDGDTLANHVNNLLHWKIIGKDAQSVNILLIMINTHLGPDISSQADKDRLYNLMKKKWKVSYHDTLKRLFENIRFFSTDKGLETLLLQFMRLKTIGEK